MTIDQEPQTGMNDSEKIIDQTIRERFTPEQSGVNVSGLAEFLAQEIQKVHEERMNVITLIGGAASGKTTLTGSVVQKLQELGLKADAIGTDDFVVGDRKFRREHFEGSNPKAKYDFKLMNTKIEAIRQLGKEDTVRVPTYDEATGVAIAIGEENYSHKIGSVDVLLVEGDFPAIDNADFIIFLHVPDAQRLENRIGRDIQTRSEADTERIVQNFNVRQEAQHFPITLSAVEEADLLVRGALVNGIWQYDVYRATPSAAPHSAR